MGLSIWIKINKRITIPDALDAEMRELFDFLHLDPNEITPESIETIMAGVSKEETKLIFRMIDVNVKTVQWPN